MQWNCILPKVSHKPLGNRKDKCGGVSRFAKQISWPRRLAGCGTESHGFNQSDKFKFSSQLPVAVDRFKAVPEREGGIAKQWRKGLKPSPRGEGAEQSEAD